MPDPRRAAPLHVPEAILRRLRSRSPLRRPPFDDPRSSTRPAIRGMLAFSFKRSPAHAAQRFHVRGHLSTPTPALAVRCTPFWGAHRCACVRRTSWMLTSARNRWRQVPRPARQLALPTGAHGTLRCSLPPPPGHRSPRRSFDRRFLRHSCPSPPCCPFGQPFIEEPRLVNRSASLDAHNSPALPCSRSRSFSRVLLDDLVRTHCLRIVTAATTPRFFHARPHTCLFRPCGPNEHTHCARSYSAYCHRDSLARSSRFEPPCSSFRAFRPDLRVYGIASVFA